MKSNPCCRRRMFAVVVVSAVLAVRAQSQPTGAALPFQVPYESGDAEFAPGDLITIEQVRGTRNVIATGETYSVEGRYTLSSRDEAELAFFATTANTNFTPIDPKQTVRIRKGSGSFHLSRTMTEDGYLHLTFYPVPSGSGFGGVYFGQGQWVLRNKGWSQLDNRPPLRPAQARRGDDSVSMAGPNRALFEYLGNPVEPPANMDPAYAKEGLINAIQLAAREAGVAVKNIQIEDSEFPFLVGLACEEGDFAKLRDRIRKMDHYEYAGSVSSKTHCAFNLVPYRAFPTQAGERIGRRLTVRQRMLFDRISRE